MFKKFSIFLLASLIFSTILSTSINVFAFIEVVNNNTTSLKTEPYNQKKPRFWTEENLKFLNKSEKEQLFLLQDKLKKGEDLSKDERKQLWALKDIVIKSKLGEEKYEDFKALLIKKKGNIKLTDLELTRLKTYFKEIKGD